MPQVERAFSIGDFQIEAANTKDLAQKFADRGLDLNQYPSRTRRPKLEKELYCLRRYLFTLDKENFLKYPIKIEQSEAPDFLCVANGMDFGVEITEATHPCDQQEMTKMEEFTSLEFQGYHGGRFSGGASGDAPERTLIADIVRAIRRKRGKIYIRANVDLVIYGNSNATFLIFNEDRAINMVNTYLQKRMKELKRGSILNRISLILGHKLAFNIGEELQIFDLQDTLTNI